MHPFRPHFLEGPRFHPNFRRTPDPITTVFVGNIPDKSPEHFIGELLSFCGQIYSWKRVAGATFGFCEFTNPATTLCCLRLVNGLAVGDKKLVVKVDDKNRDHLDKFLSGAKEDEAHDTLIRNNINKFLEDHKDAFKITPKTIDPSVLEGSVEDDKKGIVTDEILSFRERFRNSPMKNPLDGRKHDDKSRRSPDKDFSHRRRSRSKDRDDRKYSRSDRDRGAYGVRSDKNPLDRGDKSQRDEKSPPRKGSGAAPLEILNSDEEDELYEKQRKDRQIKEAEEAYQKRLREWQIRERRKTKEYTREKEKEEQLKKKMIDEAARLKEFLEDYIDERDDQKYYQGSAFDKRQREREKELAADARDRQREKEEIEGIRQKLTEEGVADVDIQIEVLEKQKEEHLVPKLRVPANNHSSKPHGHGSNNSAPSEGDNSNGPTCVDSVDRALAANQNGNGVAFLQAPAPAHPPSSHNAPLTINSAPDVPDPHSPHSRPKRRACLLPPLPADVTPDQKKACIRQLIEKIPTSKSELFSFNVDWDILNEDLITSRIKPWIDRKIMEYIGEKEDSLSQFVISKVQLHSPPLDILNDIAMVLDDEAEVFVSKLWRLIIYETEARKIGISR